MLAKAHVVPAGSTPSPLPPGPPLKLPLDIDAYMAGQRSAALLIVHDGKLRLERYGLGFDGNGRWTSFSVAKSITSTLVGAAIRDGHIKSMDDKVTDYIPQMKGSAYDDVSIRQLLTMTSGVQWNEDYADPKSDVALFNNHKPEEGVDALVSYMRRLPRAVPPGTRWNYSTGETNLVGILVNQATKKPLATYLSEKIWVPAGMGSRRPGFSARPGRRSAAAASRLPPATTRVSGSSSSAARKSTAKASFRKAGWPKPRPRAPASASPDRGYGYQWWTYADGSYAARGIFGQGIFIDPKRKIVIVSNANWAEGARDPAASGAREAFYRAVQKAIDDEAASAASPK